MDKLAVKRARRIAFEAESGGLKQCRSCGLTKPVGEFYLNAHNETRKPDCDPCRQAKDRERAKAYYSSVGKSARSAPCGQCGEPCQGKTCRKCKLSERRFDSSGSRLCSKAGCDLPNHPKFRFCIHHQYEHQRATGRQYAFTCAACGAEFFRHRQTSAENPTCGDECARRVLLARNIGVPVSRLTDELISEARKRRPTSGSFNSRGKFHTSRTGAVYERISRSVVFDLGGDSCHLCGEKIDYGLKFPDPMSATVDHVVPLTRGGDHTYANCRPAHSVCNIVKSNHYCPDLGNGLLSLF